MAKLDTNLNLPNEYWSDQTSRLMWWICTVPPYYCINKSTDANSDPLFVDQTWLGPNYWNGASYIHASSPGIKFAYTIGSGSSATTTYSNAVTFWSSSAEGSQTFVNLNKSNGYYNSKTDKIGECLRPGTYAVGTARDPLFVGPYPIDKTLLPQTDGDLLLILTGSDVMGGSQGSGDEFSSTDHRAFNVLFYYTGSDDADIDDLTGRITGTTLDGYDETNRGGWIGNAKYGHAFVGASGSGAAPDQLMWWPITWDENNNTEILSSNNN